MSIYSQIYRYRTNSLEQQKKRYEPITQESRFLNLPQEIRDEILSYVLDTSVVPPQYPPIASRRQKLHDIHYPPYRPFRYPPCVWSCQQLRRECFEMASKRGRSNGLKADLDVIFKGYLSWPTWTDLAPILPREQPFDLNVTLRVFSTEAFRYSDGWPRQPGTAFRDLLWMLNSLLHNGPSLQSNRDIENGLYRINKLSVSISFHDDYTPDTFSETAHNIFRMLKALATVGLTNNIVKSVHAHTEFTPPRSEKQIFDAAWDVPEHCDSAKVNEWNGMGFFSPAQIYSRSRYPTAHSAYRG